MKRIISPKITRSARGQDCTLQIPGHCNYNPETTVAAHMNFDGGKMGGKTHDISVAYACSGCHSALDAHLVADDERYYYMARGLVRTLAKLIEQGVIKCG